MQVFVQQKDKDSGLSAEVKVAKLSMIDLAGSEKGCVTGNKGARFREGSNINKSLLGPPFFPALRIREFGAFLTPGSGMGKKKFKIRIRDEQPVSYF